MQYCVRVAGTVVEDANVETRLASISRFSEDELFEDEDRPNWKT